jgi:hypothetical protein
MCSDLLIPTAPFDCGFSSNLNLKHDIYYGSEGVPSVVKFGVMTMELGSWMCSSCVWMSIVVMILVMVLWGRI